MSGDERADELARSDGPRGLVRSCGQGPQGRVRVCVRAFHKWSTRSIDQRSACIGEAPARTGSRRGRPQDSRRTATAGRARASSACRTKRRGVPTLGDERYFGSVTQAPQKGNREEQASPRLAKVRPGQLALPADRALLERRHPRRAPRTRDEWPLAQRRQGLPRPLTPPLRVRVRLLSRLVVEPLVRPLERIVVVRAEETEASEVTGEVESGRLRRLSAHACLSQQGQEPSRRTRFMPT